MENDELVGRPLVPFFQENNQVNDQMLLANTEHEEINELNARVWNSDGYFEFPGQHNETQAKPKTLLTPAKVSSPLTTNKKNAIPHIDVAGSAPKVPGVLHITSPLYSSCDKKNEVPNSKISNKDPRSASQKRVSTSKQRNKTPQRKRGDSRNKDSDQKSNHSYSNGDGSSAGKKPNGSEKEPKWAWSAFQSSPDPKCLPMPKFDDIMTPGENSFNLNCLDDLVDDENESDSTSLPPPPSPPPLPQYTSNFGLNVPPDPSINLEEKSIEVCMTEDLRKILNLT